MRIQLAINARVRAFNEGDTHYAVNAFNGVNLCGLGIICACRDCHECIMKIGRIRLYGMNNLI